MLRSHFLLCLAIPIALVVAPLNLYAQSVNVERIVILEQGIYEAQDTGKIDAPGTSAGTVKTLSNIQLVQHTTTVPMRLGVRFGFRYTVVGSPNGAEVPLKFVIIFPAPGLYNPDRGQNFSRSEYILTKTIGEPHWRGYGFGQPWMLVPGVWTFQIWYQDRMLGEQRFAVVKP